VNLALSHELVLHSNEMPHMYPYISYGNWTNTLISIVLNQRSCRCKTTVVRCCCYICRFTAIPWTHSGVQFFTYCVQYTYSLGTTDPGLDPSIGCVTILIKSSDGWNAIYIYIYVSRDRIGVGVPLLGLPRYLIYVNCLQNTSRSCA
jgi:hypothetical protein